MHIWFLRPLPVVLLLLQGYELHWATNFLGHFALTQHLLPSLLEQRARVVVASSILHTYVDDAGPDWNYSSFPSVGKRVWWADLPGLAGGWWAYCRCVIVVLLCVHDKYCDIHVALWIGYPSSTSVDKC
jgi:NAD(P)-dependent dehydrogenase (short-subunit alcohol dehydrogenase family)